MIAKQRPLFDLDSGQALKQEALDAFEVKATDWLDAARESAALICRTHGAATSDDVLDVVGGAPPHLHHNVIGGIFHSPMFERVGFRPTRRPQGHARIIGVWRLKEE